MARVGWAWVIRYAVVIAVVLVMGFAVGEFGLFKSTTLGVPRLTAARLAQFLSYGAALLMLWLLARRAALELRSRREWVSALSYFILPLATLIVVPAAYYVLLILIGRMISPAFLKVLNWVFVLGTTASAVWLIVALFQHSESLAELLRRRRNDERP